MENIMRSLFVCISGISLSLMLGALLMYLCFWIDTDILGHVEGYAGGFIGILLGGFVAVTGTVASIIWPFMKRKNKP